MLRNHGLVVSWVGWAISAASAFFLRWSAAIWRQNQPPLFLHTPISIISIAMVINMYTCMKVVSTNDDIFVGLWNFEEKDFQYSDTKSCSRGADGHRQHCRLSICMHFDWVWQIQSEANPNITDGETSWLVCITVHISCTFTLPFLCLGFSI